MIKKECFKKSAIHDYKNLGLIVVVIAAFCGLIYAAHYIVTTYGEAIASGKAAILGFIGGVCTAYNLCCFFTIVFAIMALKSTCESPKYNDQKNAESGGLYQDMMSFLKDIASIPYRPFYFKHCTDSFQNNDNIFSHFNLLCYIIYLIANKTETILHFFYSHGTILVFF